MKFKPGDEVVCFRKDNNLYTNMIGIIREYNKNRNMFEVMLYNCLLYKKSGIVWSFVEKEMRFATKLDKVLK